MRKNTILGQMLQLLSRYDFQKGVDSHGGDHYTKTFDCWQQLIVLLYAQGKGLNSLRDIVSSLKNYTGQWYHLGLKNIARSTMSDANNNRSCDIFQEYFYIFLDKCKRLSPHHNFKFKNPLYSMDASLVSLCLSMFPWAKYRQRKGALKLHTLLDHRGNIPAFISLTDGKCHEINVVKDSQYGFPVLPPDSIIAVDRGYIDFKWLFSLEKQHITFVTRAKENMSYVSTGQHKVPQNRGVISDESIMLTGHYAVKDYPQELRLIKYFDKKTGKTLWFLTNNFKFGATTITDIYKARWQIELFFKWIKQNLKIKSFLGTSENAVMTQIWIAMIYYLLLAFIKFQTKYSFSMLELTRTIKDLMLERRSLIDILRLKYDSLYKIAKPEPIQLSFW